MVVLVLLLPEDRRDTVLALTVGAVVPPLTQLTAGLTAGLNINSTPRGTWGQQTVITIPLGKIL